MEYNRKLVMEDGAEYYGTGFGYTGDAVCEIVFNTSMVGYQEIISDPSYTYQAVVMTYPLIGNYGTADEDYETKIPTIGGLKMCIRDSLKLLLQLPNLAVRSSAVGGRVHYNRVILIAAAHLSFYKFKACLLYTSIRLFAGAFRRCRKEKPRYH